MTHDEKLAIISGNLRGALSDTTRSSDICTGTLFELAEIAVAMGDGDSAVDTAKLVIPDGNRRMLAEFCRLYSKYGGEIKSPFLVSEVSDSHTVMIPEIAKLEDAVAYLNRKGLSLEIGFGDSFSACAEDVEYGYARYVLMPIGDPVEGRLRSFDRLRDRYGLKIHCTVNIPSDDSGEYSYQLCALGFPDRSVMPPSRLSFSADIRSDMLQYLDAVKCFDASLISAEIDVNKVSRVRAVADISGRDETSLCGLCMYLGTDADLTVDGCYAEF